ncbi:MAG TPA: hypothetical protein PK514_05510 [Spirochaetota bacterium]|nr:hypothetical protein [Spirochaetota bacterium]
MNPEVKKITDRKIMYDYLKKLFTRKMVFLKTKELNIETSSFVFNEDGVIFTLAEPVAEDNVSLYIRNGNELLLARALIVSRSGNEYKCTVSEMLIMNIPRKEERIKATVTTNGGNVYISNIISDFTLKQNFEDNKRKILALKDDLEAKLGKKYEKVTVYAVSEQKNDLRMNYFIKERKPYFIKDVTQRCDDDPQYKYYIDTIYHEEHESNRRMISEIAVPFLYRYMMPFGYLRVNESKPLTDEDYSSLKKTGMSISTYFTNDKSIIKSSSDRIYITDLSMTGLGVIFKERAYIRHFRENSLVIFTVYMPGDRTSVVMCEVKNITILKNGVYRVGCSIMNFDAIGEVNYTEYLETTGISTDPSGD